MRLPDWTPFAPATSTTTPAQRDAMIADAIKISGISLDQATALVDDLDNDRLFLNSRYQVACRKYPASAPFPDIGHLSIKRLNKAPIPASAYRDFMRIKDEICGPEFEAVQIFPARSDEIDTANQYHLWVFLDPSFRLPFGWHGQRLVSSEQPVNGRQEPL